MYIQIFIMANTEPIQIQSKLYYKSLIVVTKQIKCKVENTQNINQLIPDLIMDFDLFVCISIFYAK